MSAFGRQQTLVLYVYRPKPKPHKPIDLTVTFPFEHAYYPWYKRLSSGYLTVG